jgi:MerR family transcriptional regulator, heat shock protein HspR
VGVDRLDDEDYPAMTMGQAAELLDVQPAFLRSLDAAGVLEPIRSGGGHRRYSRRQLRLATRMRELFDEGLTLDAAARIVVLQDELDEARTRIAVLESRLAGQGGVEHSGAEHSGAEHSGAEHSGAEHSGAEHSGAEHADGPDR